MEEYWSGLPCPLPGDLLDPGMEPVSLTSPALADGFFTTSESLPEGGLNWELGEYTERDTQAKNQKHSH